MHHLPTQINSLVSFYFSIRSCADHLEVEDAVAVEIDGEGGSCGFFFEADGHEVGRFGMAGGAGGGDGNGDFVWIWRVGN